MRLKIVTITSILFLTVFSLNAENGVLKGNITDALTGETLIGANVYLEGTTNGTTSDIDGNFTIKNLKEGVYNIVCSYISYSDMVINNVEIKSFILL